MQVGRMSRERLGVARIMAAEVNEDKRYARHSILASLESNVSLPSVPIRHVVARVAQNHTSLEREWHKIKPFLIGVQPVSEVDLTAERDPFRPLMQKASRAFAGCDGKERGVERSELEEHLIGL